MQQLFAKACWNVTRLVERLHERGINPAAFRVHSVHAIQREYAHGRIGDECDSLIALKNAPIQKRPLPARVQQLQHTLSTQPASLQTNEATISEKDSYRNPSSVKSRSEAQVPLPNVNPVSTPGTVVIGFDSSVPSGQPPSWAPSLMQGRGSIDQGGQHELAPEPLPADPTYLFPETQSPQYTVPRVRHFRDWASRATSVQEWLRLVRLNLLRKDVPLEEVSFVHISSAHHAMAILIDSLSWRDQGSSALLRVREDVNSTVLELAERIEHWPTCNNNQDIASFLWRLQQLCIVKCPDHMKVRRRLVMLICAVYPVSSNSKS